jgi:transposase
LKGRTFSIDEKIRVLELARTLGSVEAACREAGMAVSTYYGAKKAYERSGRAGLEARPRPKPKMPNVFAEEITQKILELTYKFPTFSCERIGRLLREQGLQASDSGVRKTRKRFGLTRKEDRLLRIKRNVPGAGPCA